ARARHDEIRTGERLRTMAPQFQLDAERLERLNTRNVRLYIRQRNSGAAPGEQLRCGHAASRRAGDRHALAPHVKFAVHRSPSTDHRSLTTDHRSLSVVRLNNAKMIPTITSRVITFGSLQPICSRWWWNGAILNT